MNRLARLARELTLLRRAFRNWPSVAIAGLLWRHLPLPRRDLTLVTRAGPRIAVPLGARAGGGISSLRATAGGDEVAVEVGSLEEVLAPLPDVSLLKLDCEGCEYELLLETPAASWQRVRRVVLEYHPVRGREPSALVDRLE